MIDKNSSLHSGSCYIQDVAVVCALGADNARIAEALFQGTDSPLVQDGRFQQTGATYLGQVDLAQAEPVLKPQHNSRNNQLLQYATKPLREEITSLKHRFGAHRIGVVIGSSTSGIYEGENATIKYHADKKFPSDYHYQQQEIGAPALFLADRLGLKGPVWSVSTACTSGAKALSCARRLLLTGCCDAVVAGGADTLCRLTVQGFAALGAVSSSISTPFTAHRDGINIGEGAALFVLSQEPNEIRLSGCGESSDAYHISAPDPAGHGAELAMKLALQQAGLSPDEIDYINLHGTGTTQNDAMESAAVYRLFGRSVNCSSTKSMTGHTLGAAGALEAAFCYFVLHYGSLPAPSDAKPHGTCETQRHKQDASRLGSDIAPLKHLFHHRQGRKPVNVMSNSFAFGGNNTSLILSRRGN